jgi:hypothetical protein
MKQSAYLSSRPLLAIILLGISLFVTSIYAQQTNNLETYKTVLQRQEQGLLIQYSNALNSLTMSLKQKGNLDAYLVVEAEKKRFNEEKTVLAPVDAKDAYRPAVEAYNKASVDLLKKYIVALDGLIKKLMMADSMEEASATKTEKERAESQLKTALPMVSQPVKAAAKQPAAIQAGTGKKPIPEGAVAFKGHHYKLFTDGADWDKASFRCKVLDGHLVVISDDEENGFVYNLMRGQRAVWIGAYKSMGAWRWCSPTRFEFQKWAPGEPNSGKTGGFAACILGDWDMNEPIRSYWDDRPGNNHEVTGYVCEWDYSVEPMPTKVVNEQVKEPETERGEEPYAEPTIAPRLKEPEPEMGKEPEQAATPMLGKAAVTNTFHKRIATVKGANRIDITTLKGQVYKDCKVMRVEADAVTVENADGISRIFFEEISDDQKKALGYDPVRSAEYQASKQQFAETYNQPHSEVNDDFDETTLIGMTLAQARSAVESPHGVFLVNASGRKQTYRLPCYFRQNGKRMAVTYLLTISEGKIESFSKERVKAMP